MPAELERQLQRQVGAVVKQAPTKEHVLEQTTLFLHSVDASLTTEQQQIMRMLHDPDELLKGRRILLVDDDMRNTFALSRVLRQHGLQVVMADNGQMALDKLAQEENIELVLMDIMMPLMDGYEAMQRIRAQNHFAQLPIIALTAKAMLEDRAKCLAAGANDYMTKPIDVDKLLSLLRIWLFKDLEPDLLLHGIAERYGYDFRRYARSSLRRRVAHRMTQSGAASVSELLARMLRDEALFAAFLHDMSVNVTAMFRDPPFYRALRESVVPVLQQLPLAKVWHAGCATGQEAFSMAILLHEAGCLDHCRLYATDYNSISLATAEDGILPLRHLSRYAANYYRSGGLAPFSSYIHAQYGRARICNFLRRPIKFSTTISCATVAS